VFAKEMVLAINGVNPSTDLEAVSAARTHGTMGNISVFFLVK